MVYLLSTVLLNFILFSFVCFNSCDELGIDYNVIATTVIDSSSESPKNDFSLSLMYSQRNSWVGLVQSLITKLSQEDKMKVENWVINLLDKQGFSWGNDITIDGSHLKGENSRPSFTSYDAVQILRDCLNSKTHGSFNFSNSLFLTSKNFDLGAISKQNVFSGRLPEYLLNGNKSRWKITIYQTRDAFTGGTTAMRILYNTLNQLKFPVVLCNASNAREEICRSPKASDLVITGEWCKPVIDDYLSQLPLQVEPGDIASNEIANNSVKEFLGRGIQYYLGFHHGRDSCRGWVATAVSHYTSLLLGFRSMHAYFLGAPMTENIEKYANIVRDGAGVPVFKEDLIVVDADFLEDYPPEKVVGIEIPHGYKAVLARGLPSDVMPLLLQRAKIVLDLAMPGAERLSAEGILFGAIPVLPERWNGASSLDYNSWAKANSLNESDIRYLLHYATENYRKLLNNEENSAFYQYVESMPALLKRTVELFFSSAQLQFIIRASNLHEENLANYQLLSLLYIFPLASVDLYVTDRRWYMRHHYLFIDLMHQAGYLRVDEMDPSQINFNKGESYVRIFAIASYNGSDNDYTNWRPWEPAVISLPVGLLFLDPTSLYTLLPRRKEDHIRYDIDSMNKSYTISISGGGKTFDKSVLKPRLTLDSNKFDHVCNLLQTCGQSNHLRHLVCGVLETLTWKALYRIYSELEFKCND